MVRLSRHDTIITAALNPRLMLGLCIGILYLVIYSHNFSRPIFTNADPDIAYIYQALLINDGLPQEYFDHTGYLYILFISLWLNLLHLLGFLDFIRLEDFFGLEATEFELKFHLLVQATRYLSFILAAAFTGLIGLVVKLLTRSHLIAAMAVLVFVFSPGLILQGLIIRPELLSSLFVFAAFLTLVHATRSGHWRLPFFLAITAFLSMSAMMVKLQVVPLLFALPVLVLAFGQPALQPRFPWQKLGSQPIIIATVCGSAAFTIPALTMIFGQALLHDWAIYQLVIAIYFVSAIVIYTRIYHHDWRTALIAISAVATGWSAAQYLHLLTNDIDNTGALANFIEHMMKFTNIDHNNSLSTGLSEIFLRAFRATVLRSFDLSSSAAFPLRALYFLSIPGLMILAWSRNYKRLSQCLLLLGTAFLMEVYCGLRGWTPRYYIFSTPWLIAGFGLLTSTALIELKNTNTSSMVQKVAGIGVLVTVAWISLQSFSLAISERRWQEPVNLCYQTQSYMHRLPGAFDRFCPK